MEDDCNGISRELHLKSVKDLIVTYKIQYK